jgi:LytS/YehU family sensor histidine kinase
VYLFAAVITLAVSTLPDRRALIVEQLVYSYAICTLNWLFVDVGDLLVFNTAGKRFPFSKRRYLFAFFAVIVAHILGTMIGDLYSSQQMLTNQLPAVFIWQIVLQISTFSLLWYFAQRQRHKEDQMSTNEARLKLLESQLEPHMLFNTLANLRALIKTDPNLAADMLDRIVGYLRATLGGSRGTMHPLREEFERLEDYLELMKLRMGDRLNFRLYLCPNLDNYLVPPFILQPLVENAIKHGLEPQIQGGRIFIVANIEGNKVSLEVNDTGAGAMAEDFLKTKGFGWAQVSERLTATYGNKATINLVALDGYNTSAKITFPYIEVESAFE